MLRIHPPDVIGKYAPDSVIGMVGSGAPAPAASGGLAEPLLAKSVHQAGQDVSAQPRSLKHGRYTRSLVRVLSGGFCKERHERFLDNVVEIARNRDAR